MNPFTQTYYINAFVYKYFVDLKNEKSDSVKF